MGYLVKLTLKSAKNDNTPIDVIYPNHDDALQNSHLAQKTFPTLGTLLNTKKARLRNKELLDEIRDMGVKKRSHQIFFA